MSCNLSYAQASKAYVEDIARRFVKHRADVMRKRQEEYIQEEMKPKWYRPWAISYEKAKKEVNDMSIWSDYKLARLEGLWDSNRCVDLVSLCMMTASDTIMLSSEDAEMLTRNNHLMETWND